MRTVGVIGIVVLTGLVLALLWLFLIGGAGLFLAMAAIAAASAVVIRRLLSAALPRWSKRRVLVLSSALLPAAFWLVAVGVDLWIVIDHRINHPGEGYMAGLSIMVLPGCIFAFFAAIAGLLAIGSRVGALGGEESGAAK